MRIILFFCLILFACQSEVTVPDAHSTTPFFDLPTFFEQEIEHLQQEKIILQKTSTINGQIESQDVQEFDLTKELAIFINANINKTTWLDQYQIDSLLSKDHQLATIHYTALNKNLKTKKLTISFKEGVVEEIEILKGIDNMAVQSNQALKYFPKKGYKISNEQSLVLSDPQKVEIAVNYIWE